MTRRFLTVHGKAFNFISMLSVPRRPVCRAAVVLCSGSIQRRSAGRAVPWRLSTLAYKWRPPPDYLSVFWWRL